MKTLVLTDGGENDALATAIVEKVQSLLGSKGDFALYNVNQWELKKCVGCFSCWIKSPGLCMFRDKCCDINKDESDCDMLVIITKVCYGCYGPQIKTVLDRSIPNLQAFLELQGENLLHVARYSNEKYALVIAYGDMIADEEKEMFQRLVAQNALYFHWAKARVLFCEDAAAVTGIALEEGDVR